MQNIEFTVTFHQIQFRISSKPKLSTAQHRVSLWRNNATPQPVI